MYYIISNRVHFAFNIVHMKKNYSRGWTWASKNGLYQTKEWRRLRRCVLDQEPLCRMCATQKLYVPATMVDHIIAITEHNADLFLDVTNLQPLCDSCHAFKTQRDKVQKKEINMDDILSM